MKAKGTKGKKKEWENATFTKQAVKAEHKEWVAGPLPDIARIPYFTDSLARKSFERSAKSVHSAHIAQRQSSAL